MKPKVHLQAWVDQAMLTELEDEMKYEGMPVNGSSVILYLVTFWHSQHHKRVEIPKEQIEGIEALIQEQLKKIQDEREVK